VSTPRAGLPEPGLTHAGLPTRAGGGTLPGTRPGAAGGLARAGRAGRGALSDRLTAVARLVQIGSARGGPDGFSAELVADAEELLARSGERLRLSAEHTIVVLAGGTGSGKSSLFNLLAGADFSPVGAVRPVTRQPYACVWGMAGAGPLLDWLGVQPRHRYARSSALDEGERSLAGLLLVDLPDHDSVLAGKSVEVNRLVGLADLMVWVLDPQKYADAAVHSRYLVPLAGHSSVLAVVLNQADLLAPDQVGDCVADLQRLLEGEGLPETRVAVTSAATGAGVEDLRKLLVETVLARHASLERISANVDALAGRFTPYAGETGEQPGHEGAARVGVPEPEGQALAEAFCRAAGVPAVGRALQSAREMRAVDYVGWPVSWLADRVLRRDPLRKVRLGALWDELRGMSAGSAGAQRAVIDNAITAFADGAGQGLPAPWPATVLGAARARQDDVTHEISAAVARALPAENSVSPWWRAVAAWQGLLLGAAAAGLGWVGALIAVGVFHASPHAARFVSDAALLPWALLAVAGLLAVGWLTSAGCMALVVRATTAERERSQAAMREGLTEVARQLVIAPVEQELSEYARFRDELAVALGTT
jgi:energy-coupling factor transporter ATP-binding protein EcfA2